MRKLLALISIASLGLNSGVTGAVLLKDSFRTNIDDSKITTEVDNNKITDDKNKDKKDVVDKFDNVIGDIIKIISEGNSPVVTISKLLPYLTNENLSNDLFVTILQIFLPQLKNSVPNLEEYLSYLNFGPSVSSLLNEISTDWEQQSDYGDTPLEAIKNFINSNKGDIAQAKRVGSKDQWHYVAIRAAAQGWGWDEFYQYMAGANLNYMIKILSGGNYIGELVNHHLSLGPWQWGFDEAGFLNDLSAAIQKLPTTKAAWPYLIKTIVPLLKTKILQANNPTLGFDNLTWEKESEHDLSVRDLVTQVKHLLSPEGHNDLVNILASVLTGPFGEDIIINCWTFGYFTFPKLLETVNSWPINWIIGDKLKPTTIAESVVNEVTKITNDLNLTSIFDQIISTGDAGIEKNPVIDLPDLANDLNKFYQTDNFEIGLNQLIDLINGNKNYQLKDIFALWGVQKTEKEFKTDSPLFSLKKWIDDKNSILNHVLNILINIEEKG